MVQIEIYQAGLYFQLFLCYIGKTVDQQQLLPRLIVKERWTHEAINESISLKQCDGY